MMGVELVRDDEVADVIRELFASAWPHDARQQPAPGRRARRRDRDRAAHGTAPGLICPVGDEVVYAVPGVPYEMKEMLERAVLPDLAAPRRRAAGDRQPGAAHLGRERVARGRAARPAAAGARRDAAHATIAFLASGIEGIKVRLTAARRQRGARQGAARRRGGRGARAAGRHRLQRRGPARWRPRSAGCSRRGAGRWPSPSRSPAGWRRRGSSNVPGSSDWFKGGVVAYDSQVKFDVLDVPEGPVVSEAAAKAMADGVRRLLEADVGLVDHRRGRARPSRRASRPGTVWLGRGGGRRGRGPSAAPPRRPRPRPPAQRDQPDGPAAPQAARRRRADHPSIE